MSWQPRELSGRDMKNEKERITTTSYIFRDGKVPFSPSFLVRNFPREMLRGTEWKKDSTKTLKNGQLVTVTTQGRFLTRVYRRKKLTKKCRRSDGRLLFCWIIFRVIMLKKNFEILLYFLLVQI